MAKLLTRMMNEPDNDRLRILCGVMFQQFGGMQGFVAAWIDYQKRAFEQGGFAAFRCLQTLIRLLQYCEESEPDPCDMTDEELDWSLMQQTKQLIRRCPEMAVAAADEIGWTVIPPGDGEPSDVGTLT